MPEYIKSFIQTNGEQLNNIYEAGYSANENNGCLGMKCSIEKNKMDVFFMNKEQILQYIKEDDYNKIEDQSHGKKIYLISDLDINSLFIIYI
jgi:anti-sigma regulatory factor (Ser/Thr protein kinase)